MPVTALTAAQQRMINDYIPSLSAGHPPSFALADKLGDTIVQANANEVSVDSLDVELTSIVSGTTNLPNGDVFVVVGNFPGMDASPVFASIFQAGTSANYIESVTWDGSDNLTVTVDTDPGGSGVGISYLIDGR